MAFACAADVQRLFEAAAKIDWASIAKAIESHFRDKRADMRAKESLEPLMHELAPIIAPYVAAVVGVAVTPVLGELLPILVPALIVAVVEFKGGDQDPIHDAQTTRAFNPGDPAARR